MVQLQQGCYYGSLDKQIDTELFSVSVTSYDVNEFIEPHKHCHPHISLLLKGSYLENSSISNTIIKAGQVIFRSAGYVHANSFVIEGKCFNLEWKPLACEYLQPVTATPYAIHSANQYFSLQKLVAAQFNGIDLSLQTEWVLDILKQYCHPDKKHWKTPWIDELKEILRIELSTFHSLESLSKRLHVHPVYMARAFKQKTGYTIGEFELEMKLNHAIMLIYQKDFPVFKVAQLSGFYDTAHLIKSFRFFYGTTP
jgi:AraC family transcriptional regulator